jgi:hypothetical protein
MRHLLGVPVLAFDEDVLVAFAKLEIDTAIETLAGTTRPAMLDAVTLPPVVDDQQ